MNQFPSMRLTSLIERTIENIPNSSCLILSDYGLGVLNDQGAERLISAAKEHNVPIIADPKLTGLHRTQGVDWVLFQSKGLELMRRRLAQQQVQKPHHLLLEVKRLETSVDLGRTRWCYNSFEETRKLFMFNACLKKSVR